MENGLIGEIQNKNFSCDFFNILQNGKDEYYRKIFDQVDFRQYAGILYLVPFRRQIVLKLLRKKIKGIPSVRLLETSILPDNNCVMIDDEKCMELALDHAAEQGYKKIGFISDGIAPYNMRRLDFFYKFCYQKKISINNKSVSGLSKKKNYSGSDPLIMQLYNGEKIKEEKIRNYFNIFFLNYLKANNCLDVLLFDSNIALKYFLLFYRKYSSPASHDIAVISLNKNIKTTEKKGPVISMAEENVHVTFINHNLKKIGKLAVVMLQEILDGQRQLRNQIVLFNPYLIIRESSVKKIKNEVIGFKYQIVNFINDKYKNMDLSNDICSFFQISRNYFLKKFNNIFNKDFRSYINEIRLGNSLVYLRDTRISLLKIAYDAGFNSARTFQRNFYKFYKVSPQNYRKKHQQAS
ncbi:MAG: hypothetical protein A2096_14590 [Spirochaetes bacterium GWF1_41_5]|nr:MAG: hypothetical protein A2096_14590 [Spirochaetes bacterium GWF1_41_5]HBE02500.1 hypothetical protein [Spirochaetia bacterium]